MIVDVVLPKSGMAMQDATIVSWLLQVGDTVTKGEELVEIETEKVATQVEAQASGVLVEICCQPGDVVEVGAVLARIRVAEAGEEVASPPAFAPEEGSTEPARAVVAEAAYAPRPPLGSSFPMGRMRRTVARRMMDSLANTAQLTLSSVADASATVARREAVAAEQGRITYTDILVYLVSRLIERFPMFNARLDQEQIIIPETVNIGVAVALPEGLIVPTVKQANKLTLMEISREVRRLAEAAREGTLSEVDISGGTFTVTNLGMYGIEHFTPILNFPEVAILGVGRIVDRPVASGGQLQIRPMMGLSLTIDHRVIDGAPGAEFLQALVAVLESAEF
jgi:pyruvate dehydrogenase E2 component (dihydrolipoamide acetyltransferase)